MFEHGRQCGVRRADACGARRAYLRGCRATPRISRTMVPLSATTSSTVAKRNAFLAALFLAILAVENTASMLARRYAVGVIKLQFSKNAVLAVNELMKMGFSVMMTARHIQSSSTSPRNFGARGRAGALREHLRRVAKHSPRMAGPTVVYLVVNLLSYPCVARPPRGGPPNRRSFGAHASAALGCRWVGGGSGGGDRLVSIGGLDLCVLQWRRVPAMAV